MYIICSNNKPITIEHLAPIVGMDTKYLNPGYYLNKCYIAAPSKQKAIACYEYELDAEWNDRPDAITCEKVEV